MTRSAARQHAENAFRLGRKPATVLRECKRLGFAVNKATVFRWFKTYRSVGCLPPRRVGSGRKLRLSRQQMRRLAQDAAKPDFSSRKWARRHQLDRVTVNRTLAREDFVARVCPRKPMLLPANKVKRVAFAEKYGRKTFRWWKRVTFTDSKYFGIGSSGRIFAWVKKGEKAPQRPRPPKSGPRVHVYAGVNCHGLSEPVRIRQRIS